MVLTQAGESRIRDEIEKQIVNAERLAENIAATDRHLAARQDQLYSGEDAVYKDVIEPARQDISVATVRADTWKDEIGRLKRECGDLRSRVNRLPSAEKGPLEGRVEELQSEVIAAGSRLTSVMDRITDMLDRVLYITEKH
jgi:chromosome segregation ATPase